MNVEDSVKEDENQIDGDDDQNQNLKKSTLKSKLLRIKQPQQAEQDMDEEDEENDENERDDEDKSDDIDEDQEIENYDENNTSAQMLPEDEENISDENKLSKKLKKNNNRNVISQKKNQSAKKSSNNNKFKLNERSNIALQSGTNISVNNSTHNNNNNDGINGEVETKLLESNSYACFLKQRCTKRKKTILGFVNRQIVIYEIIFSEEKEISFQLINRLELNELHEYDMSFVQMTANLQNDKFAVVLDKKFMHIFSLNQNYQIGTFSEEYMFSFRSKDLYQNKESFIIFFLIDDRIEAYNNKYFLLKIKQSQDQTKRYMNPIFWRDPFDKQKSEYFVYRKQFQNSIFEREFKLNIFELQNQKTIIQIVDNTHLNCSICFMNLKTSKRQIVILTADQPRNFVQNIRWEGCIGVIGEGGSIFILESPRCYYWENFSYRFKGLEKNQQYIEREDEFDVKENDFEKKSLTEYEFDNLKTHFADFIYPSQEKIHIDGTYDYKEKDE